MMIPILQRFYPGIEWWHAPYGVAAICFAAIPQIQARESLMAADVAMVGSSLNFAKPQEVLGEWRRRATFKTETPKKPSKQEVLDRVRAAGIEVRKRG